MIGLILDQYISSVILSAVVHRWHSITPSDLLLKRLPGRVQAHL
jgi:hypothetical protein